MEKRLLTAVSMDTRGTPAPGALHRDLSQQTEKQERSRSLEPELLLFRQRSVSTSASGLGPTKGLPRVPAVDIPNEEREGQMEGGLMKAHES